MPANLPCLDLFALVWFLACWGGYAAYYDWRSKHQLSLVTVMDGYRLEWMRQMLARENRMMDETLTGNLLRSITFFASTSILLILGLITLLKYPSEGIHALSTLPYTEPVTPFLWDVKTLLLVLVFIYAFFKYTWSLRQYNYTCIVIGAAPPRDRGDLHEAYAHRASALAANAARHFNLGLRAYYFGFAAMSWFIHPLLFIAAAAWVVVVVYRRECRSHTLHVLAS